MADFGSIEAKLNGISDKADGRILSDIFRTLLRTLRFGRVDASASENFKGVFLTGTTASVANTEFTIAHGLVRPPHLLIAVAPLTAAGGKIVRLTVTQPADGQRIYLSSPDTSAPITVYVEG